MSQTHEPFSVALVVTDGKKILLSGGDCFHFPSSLAVKGENPQKAARRLCEILTGENPSRLLSLSYVGRAEVSSFIEEERKEWPKGMKTMPEYAFLAKVGDLGEKGIEADKIPSLHPSGEKDRKIWRLVEGLTL